MFPSFLLALLAASAACSLAVPLDLLSVFAEPNVLKRPVTRSIADNEADTDEDASSNACTDFYSFTCNKTQPKILSGYKFKKNIEEAYSFLMPAFSQLLKKNSGHHLKSLVVEQQLYQSCMQLGNESTVIKEVTDEEDKTSNDETADDDSSGTSWYSIDGFFTAIINTLNEEIDDDLWQELDTNLASKGFGYAFFDINVVRDPKNPSKNIILLEPPSMKEWNSRRFTDLLSDLFVEFQLNNALFCKYVSDEEEADSDSTEAESVKSDAAFLESDEDETDTEETVERDERCDVYQNFLESGRVTDVFINTLREFIIIDENKHVSIFFNDILKNIFDSIDVTYKQPLHHKVTIEAWNKLYNEESKKHTAKINWPKIFKAEFERVGINVDNNEEIIVKNQPYFLKLARTLSYSPNKYIAQAVRAKFIVENIRYYSWDFAEEINSIDKSSFCFGDTKLYGLSEAVLQVFKEDHLQVFAAKARRILHTIVKVLISDITAAKHLSEKKKNYLKSELLALTENVFDEWKADYISNYYEDFKPTGNYFADILQYRSMLKKKVLRTLRDSPSPLPFSINDMEDPRNRFILHALFGVFAAKSVFLAPGTKIEDYYATYGVNLAGFLYTLLREDRFEIDMYYRHGSEWLLPQTSYSHSEVKCFIPEDIVEYGYTQAYRTITEIFSLKYAYEAMLIDRGEHSIKDFFKAYTETQCGPQNKIIINKVLSYFDDLSRALKCPNSQKQHECNMTPFMQ